MQKILAGKDILKCIEDDLCATCGKPAKTFTSEKSKKEFSQSGMCQACQDKYFGKDDWKEDCPLCGRRTQNKDFCNECKDYEREAYCEYVISDKGGHRTMEGDRKYCKNCSGMEPAACTICAQLKDEKPVLFIGNMPQS